MAAPVQRDQELELTVDSLAFGGNGVARLDGFVVFVRARAPGRHRARARHEGAAPARRGDRRRGLEPGPQRVEAPCAHYPACGGCRFQDLAYEAQLAAKHAWVEDSLRRIAGIAEPPLEPIVGAEDVFGYRNKMEYSFAPGPDGPELGLHRAGRWDEVLGIEHCWLTTDLGNRDPQRRCATGRARSGSRPTTRPPGEGYLRHLIVREGRNTGQALVQLVTHERERFDRERLIEVLTAFPEVRSIQWTVNDSPAEVTNLPTRAPVGRGGDRGGDRRPALPGPAERVPADEHAHGRAAVRARARGGGSTGGETVYDLYCGIGTIGLSLASDALTVWGIEISEESVACAIENAELNSIGNAAFFAGNVGQVLRELRERAGDAGRRRRRPAARRSRRQGAQAASASSPRRASSTSPATRRPSRATRSGSSRSTATALVRDAPGRHVPAHAARRVVSLLERCSSGRYGSSRTVRAAGARAGRRSATQEAERERGQRGQAADVPPDARSRSSAPRPTTRACPRRGRAAAGSACAAPRKTAKKRTSGRPSRARRRPAPGTRTRAP